MRLAASRASLHPSDGGKSCCWGKLEVAAGELVGARQMGHFLANSWQQSQRELIIF